MSPESGCVGACMRIRQAITQEEIALARFLFEEYAAWLGVDLSYQGFAAELAGLPGAYAAPRGRLLLAFVGSDVSGCVALRPIGDEVCEMKRLFVRSGFRGQGIGKLLGERIVQEARDIGYRTMRLDTLPSMHAGIRLYEGLGFVRCAAYYETPLAETVFMELKL
jgi:GNAT superfamily N-acetyltransferase